MLTLNIEHKMADSIIERMDEVSRSRYQLSRQTISSEFESR